MNTTGWILMIGFWVSIILLMTSCLYRVLRPASKKTKPARRAR